MSDAEIRIAALITYHNECELLSACLDSLAQQQPAMDEVLVYDDASDYPAADYVPAGMNVRVIRGEHNLGPARARNLLLRVCSASYVHFHDADDLFCPGWSERVRAALAEGVDAVFTEVRSFSEAGPVSERTQGLARLAAGADLTRFCIAGAMLVPSGTHRRERLLAIGGFRESLWQSEDYDLHIRLAASGVRYALVDEPLVAIRLREQGRSRLRRSEVWVSALQAVELLSGELPIAYHQDLADAAARFGLELLRGGQRDEARAAFALAERLGPPCFPEQRRSFRALARLLGAEAAETISAGYRGLLPEPLRRALAWARLT